MASKIPTPLSVSECMPIYTEQSGKLRFWKLTVTYAENLKLYGQDVLPGSQGRFGFVINPVYNIPNLRYCYEAHLDKKTGYTRLTYGFCSVLVSCGDMFGFWKRYAEAFRTKMINKIKPNENIK